MKTIVLVWSDSEAKISDYMDIAKRRKIDVVCFTDHVDFNKNDYGYNYYNPEQFFCTYSELCRNSDVDIYAGFGN